MPNQPSQSQEADTPVSASSVSGAAIGSHRLDARQYLVLVFIMLAFQFRSVTLPVLIFLTQPLSLVSGLLALWLTHTPLNVSSYMGAILLIGLDMKNGILLVEYIQQLRAEGMELRNTKPGQRAIGHRRTAARRPARVRVAAPGPAESTAGPAVS